MWREGRLEVFGVLTMLLILSLPFLAWPRWDPDVNVSVREVPIFIFISFFISMIGLWVTLNESKPLGLFVIYTAISAMFCHVFVSLAVSMWIAVVVIFYMFLRRLTDDMFLLAKHGLMIVICFQLVFIGLQLVYYDPLYFGWTKRPEIFVHGTFGHHNFLGAFLAMTGAIAPVWFIPFVFVGLWFANSLLSFIALFIALAVRFRVIVNKYALFFVSVLSAGFLLWFFRLKSRDSFYTRIDAWSTAMSLMDWKTTFFGHGIGQWYVKVPRAQSAQGITEVFYQAHNEYLQLFFETGLVGVALLVWWVHENRVMFQNSAVVAIAVSCLGIYLFHLAPLSLTAVLLIAMATRKDEGWQKEGSSRYYC